MRLNIGCGPDIKEGYINIDSCPLNDNVVVMDIKNLDFPENSIDEIYAKDILEHLSITDVKKLIKICSKICKTGSKIFIQTINIDAIIDAYKSGVWDIDILNYMLFAGKNWVDGISRNEDFHKSCYSLDFISKLLNDHGFEIIHITYDTIDEDLKNNPYCHNLNLMITGIKK